MEGGCSMGSRIPFQHQDLLSADLDESELPFLAASMRPARADSVAKVVAVKKHEPPQALPQRPPLPFAIDEARLAHVHQGAQDPRSPSGSQET
jgi:hypothetical protein